MLKQEVSVGDLIAVVSVILSVVSLLIAWSKDRQLRRREYADKIRRAAGVTTARMERWVGLSLRFFEDIQPTITDTDILLSKEKDFVTTRDVLWRSLVAAHAASSQRIADEQIEIAYADLYGYDPRIQELFVGVVERLKTVDQSVYNRLLDLTQDDVLGMRDMNKPVYSAELGNALRHTCEHLALQGKALMGEIVAVFRNEMIKLIRASDSEIVRKQVQLSLPDRVLPSSIEIEKATAQYKFTYHTTSSETKDRVE